MLTQLKINNYALIDNLEVFFTEGMTCITGETGAGKSILLGGLSLVLGKRANLSSLLDPDKKCVVEATFEVSTYQLKGLFDKLAVDYDSNTILRREILPQGKSRAFINDTPVSLFNLELISKRLLDIHSQTDTQILLENEYQFQVLDALANNQSDIEDYFNILIDYKKTIKDYDYLLSTQSQFKESLELKQFLFNELDLFGLELGMYEKFEEKLASLSHVDYLKITMDEVIQLLESESIGIVDQLFRLRNLSNGLFEKSNQFSTFKERIHNITLESEDVLEECKRQIENLEVNPNELEVLTKKIDLLNALFQKHKVNSVEKLMEIHKGLKQDIQQTVNLDASIQDLCNTQINQERLLEEFAKSISEKRHRAVSILEDELKSLVGKMGMQDAAFKIKLSPSEKYFSNGKDHLYFLFSANTGVDFKLLKKVASGGELSRIMLAIKVVLSRYKKLQTLVFDEIDSGVSGKISDSIAEIMVSLSKKLQVLTITHLPQVAAKGSDHFKVQKVIFEGKTFTRLNKLDKDERIQEIAMMLSGNQITPTAIAHAKQLMN